MEKFDKDTVKTVLKGIAAYHGSLGHAFHRAMSRIDKAKSIDEVMCAKRDLMVAIVNSIPVTDKTCYFCIYNGQGARSCFACSYGKMHGLCASLNSPWRKIVNMKSALATFIAIHYWTGGEMNAKHKGHKTNTS